MTCFIIVFDDVDRAAFGGIAFNNREGTIRSEGLHGFRASVIVVVANLTKHDASRVLLHQINFPVEIPIAFDLDNTVALEGLDQVRSSVPVGVNPDTIFVPGDGGDPLIGATIAAAMSNDAVRSTVAGAKRES